MDILNFIDEKNDFVVFKYSPYCPISQRQEYIFDKWCKEKQIDYVKINVITQREISNKIAEKYNIKHQSPQIIVIKNKVPVYHSSHDNINYDEIESLL